MSAKLPPIERFVASNIDTIMPLVGFILITLVFASIDHRQEIKTQLERCQTKKGINEQ